VSYGRFMLFGRVRRHFVEVIFDQVMPIREINDVIGQPTEGINSVHVFALRLWQQSCTPEVCGAIPPGQLRALSVALG
jgi:hypothetical protein